MLFEGTVIARTSVITRTSVTFGFFYVLYHNFEMLNWLNILKNNVNSYIYSYFNILHLLHFWIII
jgi:hypothetical protein